MAESVALVGKKKSKRADVEVEEPSQTQKKVKKRHDSAEQKTPESSAASASGSASHGVVAGRGAVGRGAAGLGGARGRGSAAARGGATAKPTAIKMLRVKNGRAYTLSVALPASIIDNAQNYETKAMLVGQIARALTIFSVDEVVVYEDRSDAPRSEDSEGASRALAFFVRNLEYLETPQYLRRQLLPVHKDLKWVGLLSPLDAPHHLRKMEKLPYREGAVIEEDWDPPAGETLGGSWVNCGLNKPVWLPGTQIPKGTRVTVKLNGGAGGVAAGGSDEQSDHHLGTAVDPREPTTAAGLYWGYQTRIATSLKAVFDDCPYDGGYDLSIGTSERGEALGMGRVPKFRHLLVAFGGLGGFEEAIADVKQSGYEAGTDPRSLFTRYVNVVPDQTSRTIRTEEALLITLAMLKPQLPES